MFLKYNAFVTAVFLVGGVYFLYDAYWGSQTELSRAYAGMFLLAGVVRVMIARRYWRRLNAARQQQANSPKSDRAAD